MEFKNTNKPSFIEEFDEVKVKLFNNIKEDDICFIEVKADINKEELNNISKKVCDYFKEIGKENIKVIILAGNVEMHLVSKENIEKFKKEFLEAISERSFRTTIKPIPE